MGLLLLYVQFVRGVASVLCWDRRRSAMCAACNGCVQKARASTRAEETSRAEGRHGYPGDASQFGSPKPHPAPAIGDSFSPRMDSAPSSILPAGNFLLGFFDAYLTLRNALAFIRPGVVVATRRRSRRSQPQPIDSCSRSGGFGCLRTLMMPVLARSWGMHPAQQRLLLLLLLLLLECPPRSYRICIYLLAFTYTQRPPHNHQPLAGIGPPKPPSVPLCTSLLEPCRGLPRSTPPPMALPLPPDDSSSCSVSSSGAAGRMKPP